MDQFKNVYETMLGISDAERKLHWVENAFEERSHCTREYQEMREAYMRLCDRLGAYDEDPDLDIIVDSLEGIQKELCFRMFESGIRCIMEKHYLDA